MTIAEQIRTALWEEYKSGKKQQDMAAAHHVTQQYISRLLSGKRSCDGLSLKAVSNMFPRATLNLHGDTVIAENSGVNNGVMGVNNGTVNGGGSPTATAEAFRSKAIAAMIDLDIPADALREVLKTLKDLQI